MKHLISLALMVGFLSMTVACSDDNEPARRIPTEVPNNNANEDASSNTDPDAENTDLDAENTDPDAESTNPDAENTDPDAENTDPDAENTNPDACVPETDDEVCAAMSAECGKLTTLDRCGTMRTIDDCGTCEGPATCEGLGTPNRCECEAPSIAELCAANNLECGESTIIDVCGTERAVDCGTAGLVCSKPHETCGGGGSINECGCTPTTCREANALCGDIPDGCGGTLACNYFCVDDVSTGPQHACAVGSGKVKCWGTNTYGQIGDSSRSKRLNPVNVLDLDITEKVAAGGGHTCALLHDGGVVCWGYNKFSQLGIATTVDATKPGAVRTIQNGATQVVSGQNHSCALVNNGVQCWGHNNYGQIGNAGIQYAVNIGRPLAVTGLTSGVKSIAAGQNHNCAIMEDDGSVQCWGRNRFGQLGNLMGYPVPEHSFDAVAHPDDPIITIDTFTRKKSPVEVPGLKNVESLALGDDFSCALKTNGEVWCWGSMVRVASSEFTCTVIIGTKPNGQADTIASQNCSIIPYQLQATQVTDVAIIKFNYSTEKITTIYNNNAALRPVHIPVRDTLKLSAGANHLCMLVDEPDLTKTNIYCIGLNTDGQLGDGTTNSWSMPVPIHLDVDENIVRAHALTLGSRNSCAITGESNVKCWGSNADGQLGNSAVPNEQSYRPFDVKIIYD